MFAGIGLAMLVLVWARAGAAPVEVGAARIDVTPTEPIRLTGYASRKTPHARVEQKLWAKALAIGSDADGPAVLITLDNCGLSEVTWRAVRTRLERSAKLRPDRIVIANSHTHSGPATTQWAPNIFVRDLTVEEQGAIDRYTMDLVGRLETVVRSALTNRQPGRLSWSEGSAGFAANRRTAGGPVDRTLPVLKAETADGRLLALVANYACHCTTLGGEFNHVCGDWAGYAQEAIEREAPGSVALVTVGCGADANPSPRGGADGGLALAKKHGAEIGAEVKRLLDLNFTPLTGRFGSQAREIQLPFGPHFTAEQWAERSKQPGIVGYHARKWQGRLGRGEKLPESLYYPITTWSFGEDLALVFLPGEVVVDYALRLKRELDGRRLWVTGYANYVPCYIPSRRILAEGGYEAEDSLWYYDRPARLSTNVEELIIRTVTDLVPVGYRSEAKKAELPPPRTPAEALGLFRLATNLTIELAAAEPLVQSPVAIDWDAQGRLWVCEMYDYPSGIQPPPDTDRNYGEPLREPPGGFTPGGRVKVLTDVDGDGRYDTATVFLDKIPFPTGVMPWRKGALVCAAPNILYAEDTNGDGRADLVRTNVTGFATHNYQARVNGFTWGLDGWLHGSSGLFGGKVKSLQTGQEIDLSGRDFRYRPDTGELEPVAGISQMGRVRDDFDNWFGNDNSTLLWSYPLPDHYVRRNPHVMYPEPRVAVARGEDIQRLFPVSRTLTRFNDPQMANIVTSACGPEIYRDVLLGSNYYGNAFICEPVHNLVRRLVLEPDGVSFLGRRAPGEERGEFLASADNWFRPVQVKTGPDGGLYVVDMYRFVVEHPRWIPPDRLKELDVRAGADMGRIYRVRAAGTAPRPVTKPARLDGVELVKALNTPNGPTRDLVHRELVARVDAFKTGRVSRVWEASRSATGRVEKDGPLLDVLEELWSPGAIPAVQAQAQALAISSGYRIPLDLGDTASARVYTVILRMRDDLLKLPGPKWQADQAAAWSSSDPVRTQVQFLELLNRGALPHSDATIDWKTCLKDRWMRAAVLSAAAKNAAVLLRHLVDWELDRPERSEMIRDLVATAVGSADQMQLRMTIEALAPQADLDREPEAGLRLEPWRMEATGALFQALRRGGRELADVEKQMATNDLAAGKTSLGPVLARLRSVLHQAGRFATNAGADMAVRASAVRLLGAWDAEPAGVMLAGLLRAPAEAELHAQAVEALARSRQAGTPEWLLSSWTQLETSVRPRVIDALIARPEWGRALLDAIGTNVVGTSELNPAQRQRLMASKDATLRGRAEKLFALSAAAKAGRADVFRKYEGIASLTGVPQRGQGLFDQHCGQCHAMRGRGHEVGPNLAEFAGKSVSDFLLAILDPNAGLNPNFLAYTVDTKDGRSLTGMVRNETASGVTVVQGGGVQETILRSDLASLRASQLSLMPEGVDRLLAPQDMADLITWLRGGRPPAFGSATPAQAAQARAEFLQSGVAQPVEVTRTVEWLPYPSWLGRWPLAYCRQNAGQERLAWKARATPRAGSGSGGAPNRGTLSYRFPVAMGHHSQPRGEFTLRLGGRQVLAFNVTLADREWTSADGAVRMRYEVKEAHAEDSCGVLVIEAPAAMAKADGAMEFEVVGTASNSQRWFGIYSVPAQ